MSGWEGYGVSVRCGALGCYQGTVAAADGGSLTLTKPFRNGFPYPKSRVTLKASDIEALEIISERKEAAPAPSTVLAGAAGGAGAAGAGAGRRRGARATVGESLQAPAPKPASSSSANTAASGKPAAGSGAAPAPAGGAGGGAGFAGGGAGGGWPAAPDAGAQRARAAPARSKPIDIQGPRPQKNNTHGGSLGGSGSLPKGRGGGGGGGGGGAGAERARRRNEACFGADAEEFNQDFDFEGNLALFDKQALWQQMRPDVVRVAAARDELAAAGGGGGGGGGAGGKLRHDQHVLRRAAPDTQPVTVPLELQGPTLYATDDGVTVPSLTAAARRRLWRALAAAPAQHAAALTLLARGVADVALRLMGGPRRLDPRNAHQRPVFAAALGRGFAAAAGAEAARLLAAHGVRTAVAPPARPCALLAPALQAYAAAGGRVGAAGGRVGAAGAAAAPDVLLLALHDPDSDDLPDHYEEMVEWGLRTRGALLLLEWGGDARLAGAARAQLAALLPGAGGAGGGRLLLANVAPPPHVFAALGIDYRPPFGAHSVLALHPHDPDPDAAQA